MENKYGLKRHIPEETKARVRARSNFGCVVCGAIPYEYDHLRTPWAEARCHDPEDIVLLCDRCHKLKGSRLISVETIERALKSRVGIEADTRFKIVATRPDFFVDWCGTTIRASQHSVVVDDEPILSFKTTANDLEPVVLNGVFRSPFGWPICKIVDNEIVSYGARLGDFTLVKNRFSYKDSRGRELLNFDLNDERIRINRIFHAKQDGFVSGEGGTLIAGNLFGATHYRNCRFLDVGIAISVGTTVPSLNFEGIDVSKIPRSSLRDTSFERSPYGVRIVGSPYKRITGTFDESFVAVPFYGA